VFAQHLTLSTGVVTLFNVSLRRSFKDAAGVWQHTHSLRAFDLLPAALALLKSHDFVNRRTGQRQQPVTPHADSRCWTVARRRHRRSARGTTSSHLARIKDTHSPTAL